MGRFEIAGYNYLTPEQYQEEVALAQQAYQDFLTTWSARDPSGQGTIVDQAVRAWKAANPGYVSGGEGITAQDQVGAGNYPVYYTKYNKNLINLLNFGEESGRTFQNEQFASAIPGEYHERAGDKYGWIPAAVGAAVIGGGIASGVGALGGAGAGAAGSAEGFAGSSLAGGGSLAGGIEGGSLGAGSLTGGIGGGSLGTAGSATVGGEFLSGGLLGAGGSSGSWLTDVGQSVASNAAQQQVTGGASETSATGAATGTAGTGAGTNVLGDLFNSGGIGGTGLTTADLIKMGLGGALSLYSANQSSNAAQSAADAQLAAANRAADVQLQMYNQTRADMAPWRTAGENALGQYAAKVAAGPGQFTADPGYQWTLDQGLKAGVNRLSASGRLGSGAAIKDATRYAEGLASTEYQNFLNRYYQSLNPYASLAGLGQQAAGTQANAATQTGNALANTYQNAGTAQASGILGSAYPYNALANYAAGQALGSVFTPQQQQQPQNYLTNSQAWGQTAYTPQQVNSMMWL